MSEMTSTMPAICSEPLEMAWIASTAFLTDSAPDCAFDIESCDEAETAERVLDTSSTAPRICCTLAEDCCTAVT